MSGDVDLRCRFEFEVLPGGGGPMPRWHRSNDEAAWQAVAEDIADDAEFLGAFEVMPRCHVLDRVLVIVSDPHAGRAAPTASGSVVEVLLDRVVPHRHEQGHVYSRRWLTDPEHTRTRHKIAMHLEFIHDATRCTAPEEAWA